MKMHFDHLRETILILDKNLSLLDIFEVVGVVERDVPLESCYLTYKSHLIAEGCCALCGELENNLDKSCVSNSGRHSIVGRRLDHIPEIHRATSYDLPLYEIRFEEFTFYVEKDNLFPVHESLPPATDSFTV